MPKKLAARAPDEDSRPPPEHSSAAEVGTGAAQGEVEKQVRPEHSAARLHEQHFPIAIGEHVGAVEPGKGFEPRIEFPRDGLIKLLTTHKTRHNKDGPYIV